MGSLGAMQQGSKDRYFQGDVTETEKLVPEGIEGRVPYKGQAQRRALPAGRRAAQRHGLLRLSDHRRLPGARPSWCGPPGPGCAESHPHDVQITKEAPNYGKGSWTVRKLLDFRATVSRVSMGVEEHRGGKRVFPSTSRNG